jgi:uncharacterized membrane protein YqjE
MTAKRIPASRLVFLAGFGLLLPVAVFFVVWATAGVGSALLAFVALYVINLVVGATMIIKGRKAGEGSRQSASHA